MIPLTEDAALEDAAERLSLALGIDRDVAREQLALVLRIASPPRYVSDYRRLVDLIIDLARPDVVE